MDVTSAHLTLWYINTADPAAVLRTEPKADRGFGRKFLAQLNPLLPVTPIGQFPLNRSAQAGAGEYYIGGYPGITVVHTIISDDSLTLSRLTPALLGAIKATDVYAFALNEEQGYAGFAHWHEGTLRRSLCTTRTFFVEDMGLPEPFEGPFWAGEHPAPHADKSYLPFDHVELLHAAERGWLGIDISPQGPDLDVVGYAVDGRPEPKVTPVAPLKTAQQAAASAAAKLGLGPNHAEYDDYSSLLPARREATTAHPADTIKAVASAGAQAAFQGARLGLSAGKSVASGLGQRISKRALPFIERYRR